MSEFPIGPSSNDINVQSSRQEKVRNKAADKAMIGSKGTSEVSRPGKMTKSNSISSGLNVLRSFLGKKSSSSSIQNISIAKTTVDALHTGKEQVERPASRPLATPGQRSNNNAMSAKELKSERPVKRPLATPGQRQNYNVMSEKELKSERPIKRPLSTPGQRQNYHTMSEKEIRAELSKINDMPPPTDEPPELSEDAMHADMPPPADLPPEWSDDLMYRDMPPPSDLPPEWSDDLMHGDMPPPSDLPPEWSDSLMYGDMPPPSDMPPPLPDELGVTGKEGVEQAAKNEERCGRIFNEIATTEKTYLKGLQDFNAILDIAVKQNPKDQKLIALSQNQKAHLAKAEEFSNALNRIKDENGLTTSKKVLQSYNEKLMEGYATSISSLVCDYEKNLKVINKLSLDLKSLYPELDQEELAKKTVLLSNGIILPIQRMPRHVMLLSEIKKNASQDEAELKAILDKAQALTTQINEDKRKAEIENKRKSIFFRK